MGTCEIAGLLTDQVPSLPILAKRRHLEPPTAPRPPRPPAALQRNLSQRHGGLLDTGSPSNGETSASGEAARRKLGQLGRRRPGSTYREKRHVNCAPEAGQ